ncbi:hypothetical protein DPMN_187883 [Dreissena polymorpha]|uniref:Uncharacterized protein n=1 Tax=Dreissena polymorpha TaxID=45954 RepID=A0A9D4IAS8_DREPO|nr:hypothetical protein DPMN_187883 [Dreissena polymorpha]
MESCDEEYSGDSVDEGDFDVCEDISIKKSFRDFGQSRKWREMASRDKEKKKGK